MDLKNKLNIFQYIIGTITIGFIIYFFSSTNNLEFKYQLFLLFCAALNQVMLIKGVTIIINPDPVQWRGALAGFYILGKTIVLCLGFYIVIKYASHKTLNAIFIYIFQLINLALSIKKSSV